MLMKGCRANAKLKNGCNFNGYMHREIIISLITIGFLSASVRGKIRL